MVNLCRSDFLPRVGWLAECGQVRLDELADADVDLADGFRLDPGLVSLAERYARGISCFICTLSWNSGGVIVTSTATGSGPSYSDSPAASRAASLVKKT
jgi:hypothetical protein